MNNENKESIEESISDILEISDATEYSIIKPKPPITIDKAYWMKNAEEAEALRRERKEADRKLRISLYRRQSGVQPKHMQPGERKNKKWQTAIDKVRMMLRKGASIIALIGKRGTGKTQMACDLILQSCDYDHQSRYINLSEVLLAIQRSYKSKEISEKEIIDKISSYHLLAIDELNACKDSDFEHQVLVTIIDKRYAACRSTILIANFKAGEDGLKKYLGPSIWSRMQESGGVIVCDWDSFRFRNET